MGDAETLTAEQRNRYQRHLLLPEVGDTGQLKLLELQGPAPRRRWTRLARGPLPRRGGSGHDRNHRHGRRRCLEPSAPDPPQPRPHRRQEGRLGQEDPDGDEPGRNVVTYDVRLGADNVLDIISGYDVIVDGTDNFPTRYLVNDASLIARVPVVHGSIFRFEGQVTVFDPYNGPCYRCLIPEPPPASSLRRAPKPVSSACCPGSSDRSRRSRRSRSFSASATRSSDGSCHSTLSRSRSGPSRCAATRPARRAGRTRRDRDRRVRRALHAALCGSGRKRQEAPDSGTCLCTCNLGVCQRR